MKKIKEFTLIFPDQLFEKIQGIPSNCPIFLLEAYHYFHIQPFHKQRLTLLRAAMQYYKEYLIHKGYDVHYIEASDFTNRESLEHFFKILQVEKIHLYEFTDEWLQKDFENACKHLNIHSIIYPSPAFLTSNAIINDFFKDRKLSMAPFYTFQRKRLNILMEAEKPVGGKYSFDQENRKKLPLKCFIPPMLPQKNCTYLNEAKEYVQKHFPNSIGSFDPFFIPINHKGAKEHLKVFVEERLLQFGDYEDAIEAQEPFLFHSLLSPLLNIGLLTPEKVIKEVITQFENKAIPINSIEGFIRQIIGWREFIRASYHLVGNFQRTHNFFKHKNQLPKGFWEGKTGIDPVDDSIKKAYQFGYCHHIERLMILGNFLLLTQTNPDHIYEWFMASFIDAYDWVMVPNVYGMSQYADGGLITTKPYLSSSNYILKMSHYKKGDWSDIWDGLFWRFLSLHRPLFEKNSRMSALTSYLDKDSKDLKTKIFLAEEWLKKYTQNT